MVSSVKWEASAVVSDIMDAQFSSLASSTITVAASVVANDAALNTFMWFGLVLDMSAAPDASNPSIDLYMVESLDGTNYQNDPVTGGTDQGHLYLGSFPVRKITGNQRLQIGPFAMPSFRFKIFADNQTGKALSAGSSSILTIATNNLEGQ